MNKLLRTTSSSALAAMIICTAGNTITLRNQALRVDISEKTGTIVQASRVGGSVIFRECADSYQLREGDHSIIADEREDRVISVSAVSADSASLLCRNPKLQPLGISLSKTYSLGKGDSFVSRTVTFRNAGKQGRVVQSWANVRLDQAFRRSGDYYVPFPHCTPKMPAETITKDTSITSSIYLFLHTACVAFTRPDAGLTAASYLQKTNGSYSGLIFYSLKVEDVPTYNPTATSDGWRQFAHRGYLSPKGQSSYTIRYTVIKGDSAALLRQFLGSEDRRRLGRSTAPEWIRDVKLAMFVAQPNHMTDETVDLWKELGDSLGGGYILPIFDWYGHIGGDYPTDETSDVFRKMTEKLHAKAPAVKVFPYTNLVLGDKTKAYESHPDWKPTDAKGDSPVFDGPGRYLAQLGRPDVRSYYRTNLVKIVRDMGFDGLYVDGSDQVAFDVADVSNRMVARTSDRYALLDAVRRDLHRFNRPLFINLPGSLVGDCGFQEIGPGTWSDEGDWRALSDALYYAKLATRYRPGTWIAHLYAYDITKYHSMMLALALRPDTCPTTREQLEEFKLKWLPYVNAAFEIKDAHLLDLPLRPNWRTQSTQWDAFALKQGGTMLLSAINHGKTAAETMIELQKPEQALPGRGKLYVWQHAMFDPKQRQNDGPSVEITSFQTIDRSQMLKVKMAGDPNLVQIATVSAIPAWIASVDGYRPKFRLTDTMGISITGRSGDRFIELKVAARKPCEIEAHWPKTWDNPKAEVDGRPVRCDLVERFGQRFLVAPVPAGDHSVSIRNR